MIEATGEGALLCTEQHEVGSGARARDELQDLQWRPADNELNRRWLSVSRENGVAESWGTSARDRFAR
jgi:hypothetical protein